jgi:hypothetical protein
MSDQPKTLTAAEVLGAIDSLELMIASGGGDVEAKATLALTTYRVAARTSGLVWADGRFEPIFSRLREQAAAFGLQPQVERILSAIPDVQRMQRANEAAAHDVEALAVLVREMAAASGPPALSEEELSALAQYFGRPPEQAPMSDATAANVRRALAELRTLRMQSTRRKLESEQGACEICGRPATTVVKVILGQRWSSRCDEHCA